MIRYLQNVFKFIIFHQVVLYKLLIEDKQSSNFQNCWTKLHLQLIQPRESFYEDIFRLSVKGPTELDIRLPRAVPLPLIFCPTCSIFTSLCIFVVCPSLKEYQWGQAEARISLHQFADTGCDQCIGEQCIGPCLYKVTNCIMLRHFYFLFVQKPCDHCRFSIFLSLALVSMNIKSAFILQLKKKKKDCGTHYQTSTKQDPRDFFSGTNCKFQSGRENASI